MLIDKNKTYFKKNLVASTIKINLTKFWYQSDDLKAQKRQISLL